MTKQDAKRWVYERLRGSLAAGLVEDEASELPEKDHARITEAAECLIVEFERRAGERNL